MLMVLSLILVTDGRRNGKRSIYITKFIDTRIILEEAYEHGYRQMLAVIYLT